MIDESILENLKQSFASAVQRVHVPSIDKTLSFRESSVREHKALSKTVISNMDRQSVVYAATLAMIGNLCLDKDFDPYSISEFDRLRIIVHLFSNNFFSKNLAIKCPRKSCGESIRYPMKYGTLLKMMDSVDCSDIVFDNENSVGKTRVTVNFPNTRRYLSLLESVDSIVDREKVADDGTYVSMDASFAEIDPSSGQGRSFSADADMAEKIRKRRRLLKGEVEKSVKEKKDFFGNVDIKRMNSAEDVMLDIADIYIKRIQISSISGSDNEFDIDMSGMEYEDTEKILSVLPMGLFVGDNGKNLLKHMSRSVIGRMNACVPKITCPKCGCEISKRLTLQNFFIFG